MSAALLILAIAVQQPQDTVVLKPVVVTATRIPTPAAAVSAAVTVISGASLRERGIRTVAEALRDAPGATVVETGGPGSQTSLFLRGGESDYVKVLLDGVPLNQPGGSLDFADLTLDNVDRIEIIRGPASVLYGSDAVTGVIQIFTRGSIGAAAPRVAAAARAGTRRTSDLSADVTGGTGPLVYSASAARFGADGLYAYNSEYRNTTAGARLRLVPDARTEASLAYHYGDNVYHFPTDGAGQPADSNQVATERGPTVSLALARALGGAFDVQALGTLREQRLLFVNEADSPGEDGRFESSDLVQRSSVGALANWRRGTGSIVTVGVDYERERQRGRSRFEASFGSFPDSINVRRLNRAAYLQALLGLDRAVSLTLGVRAENNSQFGGHATYRGGVVYRAGNETRLRVSAGTGFKEPTFFENFARGFVRGNPDLDPERSTSWEAGLDHTVGALTLGVTYFDQRFRDLIEFTFTPAPPDSVNYFNVAGARAAGVEASAEASLGRGILAALRYTYLHTRVREPGLDPGPDAAFAPGERLLRRPAHALAASVRAPVGRRVLVAVDGRAVGERDDLDFARAPGSRRVTLDPYVRLNVAAEYRVARSLALTARIENVFDDRSREIANFPVAGRSLLFGLRR